MSRVASNGLIIKIFNADKDLKTMSESGIVTAHPLNPVLDYCQIGEAIEVGQNIGYIKSGEIVLFNWGVEHDEDSLLEKDETGEYRYVTEKQIFGTVKNNKKTGQSHIQPKRHYFLAEPREKDFALTKSIFQIPVKALNPMDDIPKKMGIKVGDWVVCMPHSAVPITIQRKVFFFIYLEDVLYLNHGFDKISINRKHVSPNIRLGSRKNKVELN